jgi:tripartite-type tricarboxylate transporter receptor subunit TctC
MNGELFRLTDGRMDRTRREVLRDLGSGSGALAIMAIAGSSEVQAAWPDRIIRLTVPFGPGGPPDIVARVLADPLGHAIGATVVVENKPGAGSTSGVVSVARAAPDGYTLLVCTSAFILNKALNAQLPYDPVKDFTPLSEIANAPNAFVVNAKLGVNTMSEFLALARANVGKFNYSSPGLGTTPQMSSELLKMRAGLDLTHVPYNNGPLAVQALMTDLVQLSCMAVPLLQPHVEAGTLKALAVTSTQRWRGMPDVPTMIEVGFADFVTDTMIMLAGPKSLPPDIATKLADATALLLRQPDIKQALERAGLDVVAKPPSELAERIAKEVTMWNEVVAAAGIGSK